VDLVSNPRVLIIGEVGDWSADTVVSAVESSGSRAFRLTTHDFPQRMTIAATYRDGPAGVISTADGDLQLDKVTAVYYRRPRTFDLHAGMSGPEERFARAQARIGMGGVLASLPARWMNHPSALADCEYKPMQLAVARQAGLSVPATLVTNHAKRVGMFAMEVGELVVKPLGESSVAEADGLSVAYCRRLTAADYDDLAGVETTAHLFQQWIEPRHAVRLTVVGTRLFPVAIHPGSSAGVVDWRSDYDNLAYEIIGCPERVAAGVRRFMVEFKLSFGAFDFIVHDPSGKWYFLECNAGGQWGWLAEECDLPIAEAIAAYLTGGPK
jgi:ATP-grasp ribosomal peptide maturase